MSEVDNVLEIKTLNALEVVFVPLVFADFGNKR